MCGAYTCAKVQSQECCRVKATSNAWSWYAAHATLHRTWSRMDMPAVALSTGDEAIYNMCFPLCFVGRFVGRNGLTRAEMRKDDAVSSG